MKTGPLTAARLDATLQQILAELKELRETLQDPEAAAKKKAEEDKAKAKRTARATAKQAHKESK